LTSDIPPADPLGTQQDWRQTLARTAIMESQARQQPGIEEQQKLETERQRMALAKMTKDVEDDKKFRQQSQQLSPDQPLSEYTSKLAGLAFQNNRLTEGEKLLQSAANLANKESLAAQREVTMNLKEAQELEKKVKVYQSVEQMMGASPDGWEMGNELVKSLTKEDHPLYAMRKKNGLGWAPGVGDALNAGHQKRLTGLQEDLERARIEEIKTRAARERALTSAQIANISSEIEARTSRMNAVKKTAGEKLATVTKSEKEAAMRLAREMHGDAEPAHLDRFSDDVAADAKAIQLREHGSYKDALLKAAAQNEGNWKKSDPKTFLGLTVSGTGGKPLYGTGSKSSAPKTGDVVKGYKFKGGDPSKKENWVKASVDTGEE